MSVLKTTGNGVPAVCSVFARYWGIPRHGCFSQSTGGNTGKRKITIKLGNFWKRDMNKESLEPRDEGTLIKGRTGAGS